MPSINPTTSLVGTTEKSLAGPPEKPQHATTILSLAANTSCTWSSLGHPHMPRQFLGPWLLQAVHTHDVGAPALRQVACRCLRSHCCPLPTQRWRQCQRQRRAHHGSAGSSARRPALACPTTPKIGRSVPLTHVLSEPVLAKFKKSVQHWTSTVSALHQACLREAQKKN